MSKLVEYTPLRARSQESQYFNVDRFVRLGTDVHGDPVIVLDTGEQLAYSETQYEMRRRIEEAQTVVREVKYG